MRSSECQMMHKKYVLGNKFSPALLLTVTASSLGVLTPDFDEQMEA